MARFAPHGLMHTLCVTSAIYLLAGAAAAQDAGRAAVDQTYACLSAPVADNDAFLTCLEPMDAAFTALYDDADALRDLIIYAEPFMQDIILTVKRGLSPAENTDRRNRLNEEGYAFQERCIRAQVNEDISDSLVLMRCEADIHQFILHFHFDNFYSAWERNK